ncbi:MAG: hypothetical protein ACW98Y_08455 [Candidatus Thorarchaeota archaeon]
MDFVVSMKDIKKHIDNKPDTLLVVVGINTYGEIPSEKDTIIDIGSKFYPKLAEINETEPDFPSSSMAYVFAKETMKLGNDDLALAAAGSILEAPAHKTTTELIEICTKSGLLSSKRGFKIPGTNFLPLDELFLYNIHPYLDGLSGVPSRCQKLFSDADIPLRKRTEPLSQLSTEEATQLTSVLIPRLPAPTISSVLGSDDYELLREKPESPLRYVTAINALGQVAWSRRKMGLMLGVFIGDRARLLGNLVDLYRDHCRETVEGVQKLNVILNETDSQVQTGNQYISALVNIPDVVLPDVGRIALESGLGSESKFLILRTHQSMTVSWVQDIASLHVMVELLGKNIPVSQKSHNSVRVEESSNQTHAKIIKALETVVGGS